MARKGRVAAIRRVILWDVDGTLMSAGPAGRDAFAEAVSDVLGRAADQHDVRMSGKTDPQIALEILAALAVPEGEARTHLPGVLQALERRLDGATERIRAGGKVHPGVEAVLSRLSEMPRVVQTVLTGNLEPNARVKLGAFGLGRWLDLDVAAYGSDDHDRTQLVPIAMEKVQRRYGTALEPRRAWVVGDTPLDLACARAGGTRCLLVGTGRYSFDDLRGLGADVVLPDLSDIDRVVEVLAGDRSD